METKEYNAIEKFEQPLGGPFYGSVRVFIKEEFNETFDAFLFTNKDFGLYDLQEFQYRIFSNRKMSYLDMEKNKYIVLEFDGQILAEDTRFFFVYIKQKDEKHTKAAMEHLSKLEFVKRVELNYSSYPGILVKEKEF